MTAQIVEQGANNLRVLVFGSGAIGSLLGHRLSQAGHEVTMIGRQSYVQAVARRGLRLDDPGAGSEDLVAYPDAVTRIEDLPPSQRSWDLVLLTVKAYDTSEAARALAPHLPPHAPLLIVQNGVGGEELAQQVLKRTQIISAALTLSVSMLAPAHISLETTRGGLSLAPTGEGQAVGSWAELFAEAGMKVATHPDYRALKWSKLLLNILANAIPAILDLSAGAAFSDPELFALERAAFLEALAVVRGLQLRPVSFPGYPVSLLVWAMESLPASLVRPVLGRIVASGRGGKPPSLQMDLASGQGRSEVRYLNGAVVDHAKHLGIHVPVNEVVLDTLMGVVKGQIPWDEFRGQPQKLVATVEARRG
jgi:2-dehydropantoate 2-reductase